MLPADSSPGPTQFGDTGDKVNLYIANRRGGPFLYALDVNNPVDPKFLWKISSSTTDFSELGQTWSQPAVVPALAGLKDPDGPLDPVTSEPLNPLPVLIFGGGYDQAVDDVDPALINSIASNGDVCLDATCAGATRRARSMGRGIYVVNAYTGALIDPSTTSASCSALTVACVPT